MLLTHGIFVPTIRDTALVEELVLDYLATLLHNGNLCRGDYYAWIGQKLHVYTHAADASALEFRFHAKYCRRSFRQLIPHLVGPPTWRLLEKPETVHVPPWQKEESLFLLADAFDDDTPPVRSSRCGCRVPTYRLPISEIDRSSVRGWAGSYCTWYKLWLDSGYMEKQAYRELSRPDSELNVRGRELCSMIEQATSRPTYYWVMRDGPSMDDPPKRTCPGCRRKWFIKTEFEGMHDFTHRCDSCRLVCTYYA